MSRVTSCHHCPVSPQLMTITDLTMSYSHGEEMLTVVLNIHLEILSRFKNNKKHRETKSRSTDLRTFLQSGPSSQCWTVVIPQDQDQDALSRTAV